MKTAIATAAALLTAVVVLAPARFAAAQEDRPSAMKLFPAETVLWVRAADAGLLLERLDQTSMAQLLRDPDMADLTDRVGGAFSDAYAQFVQEFLEADLQDLLRLPQGEFAFGLVQRQGGEPGLMLIADFGAEAQVAQQVFERLQTLAEEDEASVGTEQLRSDEATVIRDGNDQDKSVAVVRRESTFVIANDRDLLQATLDHWDGIPVEPPLEASAGGSLDYEDEESASEDVETDEETNDADDEEPEPPPYAETLASNNRFSATFRELMPGNEEPPQGMFYIDPIGLLEATAGQQMGVRIAMATFPALGVDGIQAFGAAMWLSTEKWDALVRGHLLLATPRSGVCKVARLETGEMTPPDFVPSSVETLMSIRLKPTRLFDDIASLYNRFQYEGAFRKLVEENISSNLPVDFELDFVNNLDGSLYYLAGYDETGNSFGAKMNFALGIVDPDAAAESFAKLREAFPDFFDEQTFGSLTYYELPQAGPLRRRPREERPFVPAVGLIGDHLVVSQSSEVFKTLIEAYDGGRPRLVDSLQHRLVMSRLRRMTEGKPFSAVSYHDSEPLLRHLHQMATAEETMERLDRFADEAPFLGYVQGVLDGAEFPPLETLLKYTAPSGAAIIDTPTGWSMIGFSFKRIGE